MTSITSPVTDTLSALSADLVRRETLSAVSWGAILSGVAGALVAQLVLSLFGLGLGLATVDPASNGTPSASSLSIGASVWWIVSGIVASVIGGFLAGRMSGRRRTTAGYHGLVSWAVTTLVIVFLISSAAGSLLSGAVGTVSSVLGGAGHAVGGAVQTAAQSVAPAIGKSGDPLNDIVDQVKTATGDQDPAALRNEAAAAIRSALAGNVPDQQQAMDRAAELLAKARNIPVDQAKEQIAQFKQRYQQTLAEAQQKAASAAETAAKATSYTAFVAGIALVLGAIAAFVGGRMGGVDRFA